MNVNTALNLNHLLNTSFNVCYNFLQILEYLYNLELVDLYEMYAKNRTRSKICLEKNIMDKDRDEQIDTHVEGQWHNSGI